MSSGAPRRNRGYSGGHPENRWTHNYDHSTQDPYRWRAPGHVTSPTSGHGGGYGSARIYDTGGHGSGGGYSGRGYYDDGRSYPGYRSSYEYVSQPPQRYPHHGNHQPQEPSHLSRWNSDGGRTWTQTARNGSSSSGQTSQGQHSSGNGPLPNAQPLLSASTMSASHAISATSASATGKSLSKSSSNMSTAQSTTTGVSQTASTVPVSATGQSPAANETLNIMCILARNLAAVSSSSPSSAITTSASDAAPTDSAASARIQRTISRSLTATSTTSANGVCASSSATTPRSARTASSPIGSGGLRVTFNANDDGLNVESDACRSSSPLSDCSSAIRTPSPDSGASSRSANSPREDATLGPASRTRSRTARSQGASNAPFSSPVATARSVSHGAAASAADAPVASDIGALCGAQANTNGQTGQITARPGKRKRKHQRSATGKRAWQAAKEAAAAATQSSEDDSTDSSPEGEAAGEESAAVPAAASAPAAPSKRMATFATPNGDGIIINVHSVDSEIDEDELCIIDKPPPPKVVVELSDGEEDDGAFVAGMSYWTLNQVTDEFSKSLHCYWNDVKQTDARTAQKLDLRSGLLHLIHYDYPGSSLHLTGSSQNGFDCYNSDVDMCLLMRNHKVAHGDWYTHKKRKGEALGILGKVRKILRTNRCFGRIELIPARVPILRFHDSYGNFEVDLNVGNHVVSSDSGAVRWAV